MSEEFVIKEWQDIEGKGWNSLLLGNGASIAVSEKFCYGTLYEVAKNGESFGDIKKIFEKLKTKDFERALLACWYAKVVNASLGQSCEVVDKAYESIRGALIETVKEVHPAHSDVADHLQSIFEFMSCFSVVFSLNYDLIVYWAMMHGNKYITDCFKDCFLKGGKFDSDVDGIRKRYPSKMEKTRLCFILTETLLLPKIFLRGSLR